MYMHAKEYILKSRYFNMIFGYNILLELNFFTHNSKYFELEFHTPTNLSLISLT